MSHDRIPNVLSIAGSDPSGGAGIQADLKSIAACGGYGMAAITALTAQNTRGVTGVHAPPAEFLTRQLEAISSDIRIDAVKIGMLATADVIEAVTTWLDSLRGTRPGTAVVLDPVLVSTSGDRLLEHDAEAALRRLLPLADVLTPNTAELAALLEEPEAADWDAVLGQAGRLAARHDVLVVAKGGHLAGAECPDALVGPEGVLAEVSGERIDTRNTHGTGCSLSSALATLQARCGDWSDALRLARAWLQDALGTADALEVGHEHGPVNHFESLWAGRMPPSTDALLSTWWNGIAGLRSRIDALAFIRSLRDGSLPAGEFHFYLAQDALYLRTYSRVLSRAAQLAPNRTEQAFWAAGAVGALQEEANLHRLRLGNTADPEPSPTTSAYLNHLVASDASYPELVAAILPCYWLYQDIGQRLAAAAHPGHPYADWLAAYSSPEFDTATAEAVATVQLVALRADAAGLAAMRRAFDESSRHELAFFAQTSADAVAGRVAGIEQVDADRRVHAPAL
ncbi:bifunctional hydroxymethylpyrimidine kinase/phosphomethylpyrimidine kinase [Arthrobacter sp. JSM 101049]|uniref:bifunctional hydroxymethylpyrimidine kinase/phosphomethylpyrimidine kinase n=1 Tax=Arthrobacter sp. JSM 101049 TaxID=929097 RepID=UPI0035687343